MANLETVARYRHALSLRNPNPGELDGKVHLVLKRRSSDGGWVEATPDPASGRVTYTEGDGVAIGIRNEHPAPIHVNVLDFGVAGAIGSLYPIAGSSEPLAADRSVTFGERQGEEIELRFPPGVADGPDPADEARSEGTETFKLIATTSPADLRGLLQPGYRDLEPRRERASPVEQLLTLALTGRGTRDVVRPARTSAEDAWVTIERPFTLLRGA
jgi:hypothetical protein